MKKAQNTAIKVACRLRPLNKLELTTGGECCTTYTDTAIKVKVQYFYFSMLKGLRLRVKKNHMILHLIISLVPRLHKQLYMIR